MHVGGRRALQERRQRRGRGKVAVFEGSGNPVEALARELIAVSQPLVNRIGPWDKPRVPPPAAGKVRMTFLVSDGLYFGEGPFAALQKDPMGGRCWPGRPSCCNARSR